MGGYAGLYLPGDMEQLPEITPEFTVSLADFKSALKLLKIAVMKDGDGELLITFDGTKLHFVVQGMETSISGQGHWPGTALVSAKYIIPLIKVPPDQDPVTLRFNDGKLKIQTYTLACKWQHISPIPIDVPMDARPIDILRLRFKYSLDDLAGAGLLTKIGELEKDVRKKIEKSAVLLEPYGISKDDLLRLYAAALEKRL
jgi:hypothetical protein